MSGFRLVRRAGNDSFPEVANFARFSCALPFSAAGERYYTAILPEGFVDASFAFVDAEGPLVIMGCDNMMPDRISRFGFPLEPWWRDGVEGGLRSRIERELIGELQRVAQAHGREGVVVRTSHLLDPEGSLAARLADTQATPNIAMRTVIDLARDEETLIADMRKGHRQQVRWGQGALLIDTVDAANPDRVLFARYQALHAEVSGRVTRPQLSWDAMFDLIAAGEGDLLLCSIGDLLVGGALVLDGGDTAFYASGANRRDHFDKPISHYPIFLAARRARARARRYFDIGETLGGMMDMTNSKELSIGRFKSGFSGTADVSVVWTIAAKVG